MYSRFKQDGKWEAEPVIAVNPKKVEGWALPDMPGNTRIPV